MAPEVPFAHYREALAEIRLTYNYLIYGLPEVKASIQCGIASQLQIKH